MDYPLKINIGGRTFEILPSTFVKYPQSIFSRIFHGEKISLPQLSINPQGEIFFDRDPFIFECLLSFCRSGSFYPPPGIPSGRVKEEALFFGLESYLESFLVDHPSQKVKTLKRSKTVAFGPHHSTST
eukprot:Sdes_comp10387_c0_seq1m2042